MASMEDFVQASKTYTGRAKFAIVYIAEAHPTDGWDVNSDHRIRAHVELEDRIAAARTLRTEVNGIAPEAAAIPLLVDEMGNAASLAFGALPERLAILQGEKLFWLGGPGPHCYSTEEMVTALDRALTR